MTDKHPQVDRIVAKKQKKAAEEIAALKRIWEGSPEYGRVAALEAFNLCTDNAMPLPPWLVRAVRAQLINSIPGRTRMHYWRWREVRKMRDERPLTLDTAKMRPGRGYSGQEVLQKGLHREIGYDETYRWVAQRMEKWPSAGSPDSIEYSYIKVEKELPEACRYERTHAKRTR